MRKERKTKIRVRWAIEEEEEEDVDKGGRIEERGRRFG
jgi:hypothetical protein